MKANLKPSKDINGNESAQTGFFDKNNAKKHYNEFITFVSHSNLGIQFDFI